MPGEPLFLLLASPPKADDAARQQFSELHKLIFPVYYFIIQIIIKCTYAIADQPHPLKKARELMHIVIAGTNFYLNYQLQFEVF